MFERIENYYRENQLLSENDIAKMMYAIRSIWNDLLKFLFMGLIACILNQFGLYLWVVVAFTSCRVFLGGLHKKSFLGCTVFTAGQIFGIIFLTHLVVRVEMNLMWLAGASTSLVLIIGSVVSSEKRRCTKKKKKWFKSISFVIEIFWVIMAWIQSENEVVQQGIYLAILLDNVQLVIAKYCENKRKELKKT